MLELKPGDCFLIETNKEAGVVKSHLFVVVIETEPHTLNTIIVNIQTIRGEKHDKTVILYRGDHDFIKQDSYVNYRLARIISVPELEQKIKEGVAKIKNPVSSTILQRIAEGITRSPFTPMEVKEIYLESLYKKL